MLFIGLWWWYINITITVLDIIHPPVLYLKHNDSETGFCSCFQVEPTQLGPKDRVLWLHCWQLHLTFKFFLYLHNWPKKVYKNILQIKEPGFDPIILLCSNEPTTFRFVLEFKKKLQQTKFLLHGKVTYRLGHVFNFSQFSCNFIFWNTDTHLTF
jgi:hypothetical protein